ncbi:GntR family transcriptional regulator [Rhizobium sp. Root483D2]|uniref:GntR family transcriptional regulator n=1 Tax=Rhizobium sp. Root483D2 TaxID=1736545 RepID=UPI000B115C01|nr:GntR family transcriptional regulator [Rhizobium sp. Root483D2]
MTVQQDKITTIDVRSVHERVYDELRRSLLQGHYAAGQSLTIRGLAATLGTSEMPIREAIKRLVAERMIVQLSNRTFQVPELEWAQFEELTSLRISIEGLAAKRAVPNMDDALLGKLTRLNATMKAGLQNNDRALVLRSNQEFHFALYAASGSPLMVELIEMLWMRSGPYLAEAIQKIDDANFFFARASDIHDTLITALIARDEEAVFQALKQDLWSTASWYKDRIDMARSHPPDIAPMTFIRFSGDR